MVRQGGRRWPTHGLGAGKELSEQAHSRGVCPSGCTLAVSAASNYAFEYLSTHLDLRLARAFGVSRLPLLKRIGAALLGDARGAGPAAARLGCRAQVEAHPKSGRAVGRANASCQLRDGDVVRAEARAGEGVVIHAQDGNGQALHEDEEGLAASLGVVLRVQGLEEVVDAVERQGPEEDVLVSVVGL